MREFSEDFPEEDNDWYRESNYIICLGATPHQMVDLLRKCKDKGQRYTTFIEPDLEGRLTGIALVPSDDARRLTSQLPLALR